MMDVENELRSAKEEARRTNRRVDLLSVGVNRRITALEDEPRGSSFAADLALLIGFYLLYSHLTEGALWIYIQAAIR
jgi:hypothetical protein